MKKKIKFRSAGNLLTGFSITNLADDQWVCVRVSLSTDAEVQTYAKTQVDLSTPVIDLSQQNTSILVSSEPALLKLPIGLEAVVSPIVVPDNTQIHWRDLSTDKITDLNHGDWVCVRMAVNDPHLRYASLELDMRPVQLANYQQGRSILLSYNAANVAQINYFTNPSSTLIVVLTIRRLIG